MLNHFRVPVMVLAGALSFSLLAFTQSAPPQQAGAAKNPKATAEPAPPHDISGTWTPANGPNDGIQPYGAKAMPNDGKPEHQLPYTPLGLQTYKSHKATIGVDEVLPNNYNTTIRGISASRWDSRERTSII